MAISKSSSGWQVDVQPGGRGAKRFRKTFPTKAEALQYEIWLKSKVAAAPEWAPAKKDGRRLDELIEIWYDLHGSQLRSGANTKSRMLLLCAALGNPAASTLSTEVFATYRSERLKAKKSADGKRNVDGISPNNLNRELAYLRAIFNELKRVGVWKVENPLAGIRQFTIVDRELSFLTMEQIPILLKALEDAGEQDALLVTKVCLSTGCRWSEGENLTLTQVRNGQIHFIKTKSGKNRSVPIDDSLASEILEHHKTRWGEDRHLVARLFESAYGAFRSAVLRSGIKLPKGQLSHVLRHTFASHFIMNGGNILTLQKILGHATLQMTMRYAHLAPEHLQEARTLNPLTRSTRHRESPSKSSND